VTLLAHAIRTTTQKLVSSKQTHEDEMLTARLLQQQEEVLQATAQV